MMIRSVLSQTLRTPRGDYISIFHDDDVMLPGNLEKKIKLFDAYPSVGLVHSNIYRIDSRNNVMGTHWAKRQKEDYIRDGYECFMQLITGKNIICAPAAVVRKTCFARAGRFSPSLPYSCDWEMWMRIALFFDVAYLSEPLVSYRCHPDMTTEQYLRTRGLTEIYYAKKNVMDNFAGCIKDISSLKIDVKRCYCKKAFELGLRYVRQKRYLEAIRSFALAYKISFHMWVDNVKRAVNKGRK